ncbi:MAG: hypothetical protein KC478_00255 [Bacteriovoracaceae bacterium]|nr:hypothetical protein [Bacteriovoracaceae bacterium]
MVISRRHILLIDGLGALLSTSFLGLLLPFFQSFIGIPTNALYLLAVVAAFLCIFSLYRFFQSFQAQDKDLKFIVVANAIYCLLSISALALYWEEITMIGLAYFLIETIALILLVSFESNLLSHTVQSEPLL